MGLLRLFLALSVIAGHAQTTVFGFNGIGAWYAVNLFFIISGFYMAMVLNEKYKNTKPLYFYKSRALRLFPAYYIGICLALAVSFREISLFFENLTSGAKFFYVFQNLFIFGQDLSYLFCADTISQQCASPVGMTINPPAWSLAVELGFYLIAPFVLKSEKKTFYFIVFGCVYLLFLNGIIFPLDSINYIRPVDIHAFNYYFYPASFIFFGGGALAYHLSKKKVEPHYLIAVVALAALSFTNTIMPFWHLLFISMAIPVLFNYTKKNRLDRSIGELSYPAYILHFPLILLIKPLTKSHPQYFSFVGFGTWVAILSCLLGIIIYWVVEKKINSYRDSKEFLEQGIDCALGKTNYAIRLCLFLFIVFPVCIVAYVYDSQIRSTTDKAKAAFNLTDNNWINGVHRRDAAFFVNNNFENRNRFKFGSKVNFANGDIRSILQVIDNGPYLNIYLDGTPLNGENVGFPKEIKIIE